MKVGIRFTTIINEKLPAIVDNNGIITTISNRTTIDIIQRIERTRLPIWMYVHNMFMFYNVCGEISLEYALTNLVDKL